MATEQEEALHALVCNAEGYDKSIVRALALQVKRWAEHPVIDNPRIAELAERVLRAEEQAHRFSRCADVHPIPSGAADARAERGERGE